MLRFFERLSNNRCVLCACQARTITQKRRAPSQVAKYNGRKDWREFQNKDQAPIPKSKFKSFANESALFDKTDPDADRGFVDDEDEDYDELLLNAHKSYDEYKREERERNKRIVRHIIKRKYFRDPPEPTLLTWAAKEQLRYLHDTDAETWTPERLAESFPISVSGVKKLLASAYRITSPDKILAHDKAVRERWKKLGKDGGPILTALHPKFSLGKQFAASSKVVSSLPVPDETWRMEHKQLEDTKPSRDAPVGEFERLILEHKNLSRNEIAVIPEPGEISPQTEQSDSTEVSTMQSFSPLRTNKQLTFDQFKENMTQQLRKRSVDDPEPYQKFKTWFKDNGTSEALPPPLPMEDLLEDPMVELFEGKMKKFKEVDGPELTWDVHRDSKNPDGKEAYIYEPGRGYQRPYGRFEDTERIEIPSSEFKEGAVYRRGNSYYDDTGELLYRVPFPLDEH